MGGITDVLRRFMQNWTEELAPHAIAQACRDVGMRWYESALNPVVTIQIFFVQILYGNTACKHMQHLTNMSFTAAAYCQARMRVNLAALHILLQRCVESYKQLPLIRRIGSTIGCFTSTAPVSRCPIRRSCRLISSNRANSNLGAAFPSCIGWSCCMPGLA